MTRTTDPRVRDLQEVLEITRALAATEDLQALLPLVVDRSMELLDAERASVFLYEPESVELVSSVAAGASELRIPADRGIAGETVRSKQTVNVPDAYADDRFNPEVDRQTGFRTRNILSVPLLDYHGELVGVVQVLNRRSGAFGDYEISLAEALAAQAGVALQRARLIRAFLEKQEMDRAMALARDIQQQALPERPPAIEGFDVAGLSEPADATGGDTYDFMCLDDGRCTFMIADATGHGIGPALVIATMRSMLRAVAQHSCDVPTVLRTVNDLLSEDLDDGRFVTCFYSVLDHVSATLSWASAGHGPILLYNRQADTFTEAEGTGLPLGIFAGSDYCGARMLQMQPGDFVAVTTDGFFEAANEQGEPFGVERMMTRLRRDRDLPAETMLRNLHRSVSRFAPTGAGADDRTGILIKKT